jgi:YHS domain-containing protein
MSQNSSDGGAGKRWVLVKLAAAFMICVSAFAIIYVTTDIDIPFISLQEEHSEQEGLPGGPGRAIIACLPNNHIEAFVDSDGVLGVYTLSKTAQRVVDVETQNVTAYAKAIGEQINSTKISLVPSPQEGDAPGRVSRFQGQLPKDLVGRPLWVSIPNISIDGERFRFGFVVTDKEIKLEEKHSEEVAMPKKAAPEEEQTLYLTAKGRYSTEDIEANGRLTSSQKYKGVKSEHDMSPKVGDQICPITRTKANPKFSWIVDGKTYTFCCPPCIDEFVASAKETTDPLPEPDSFLKQ